MFCQKKNLRRKKSHTLMLNFFLKLKFVRRKSMISLLFHRPQCRIVHQQLLKKTSDLTVFYKSQSTTKTPPRNWENLQTERYFLRLMYTSHAVLYFKSLFLSLGK